MEGERSTSGERPPGAGARGADARRADGRGGAPRGKWWVLVSVGVGTFMSALDSSVVNALLPVMRRALHTGVAEIEWVVTVYLLVVSGVLLGFGRLGDLRGHRRVYLAGFAGFVLASAACGLSPNVGWLVSFRAVQALAAAMLFANAPAILTGTFPAEQRGRALGLQAMMTYLGLSTGPLLGGLLASHFGWGSIFFINVPVGGLGFALALRHVPRDAPAGETPPFDRTGAALFFFGLLALLYAANQAAAWGWGALPTLVLLGAGGATLAVFVRWERRHEHPMLDLALFRRRDFSASVLAALTSYAGNFTVIFLVPFLLIGARGLSPEHAGLVLMAQPVMMALLAPVSGTLSDRLGARGLTAAGMLLQTAGLLLLAGAGAGASLTSLAARLALCGVGIGLFVAPNNSRILGAAPRHRQGIASGVLAAARNVGMVSGVGLAGAVYTTVLVRRGAGATPAAVAAGLAAGAALTALGALASAVGPSRPAPEGATGAAFRTGR